MKWFASGIIRAYQWCVSPLLPPRCIYSPSCSQYMLEAVNKHGPWRGALMGMRRLLRCHPFSHGGYDPVP